MDIEFDSLEELRDQVEKNDGVVTVRMEEVRDAYQAGRLGVHVRSNISKRLRGLGLGHFPLEADDGEPMPYRQSAPVRIYKLGSPVADLIDAVLDPGDEHDEELREAATASSSEIIDRIRELVCP